MSRSIGPAVEAIMRFVGLHFEHLTQTGYTNVNSIFRQTDRLHGTESLCGDWSGCTLVLGQDFSHSDYVRREHLRDPTANPFHHNPLAHANSHLCEFLRPHHDVAIDGSTANTCGAVYANAIWLLKDGAGMAAPLPRVRVAIETSRPVLIGTLISMPNLRRVLCLGKVAHRAIVSLFGLSGDWRESRDNHVPIRIDGVAIWALSHPGRLGILNRALHRPFEDNYQLVADDFRRALAD
jgi:hypothetical protein